MEKSFSSFGTASVGGEIVRPQLESKLARQDSGSLWAWAAVEDQMERVADQSLLEALRLHWWRKMACLATGVLERPLGDCNTSHAAVNTRRSKVDVRLRR